jgi:hypothetical protein
MENIFIKLDIFLVFHLTDFQAVELAYLTFVLLKTTSTEPPQSTCNCD